MTIENLYVQAELALASYSNLATGALNTPTQKESLQQITNGVALGMAATQAAEFSAQGWTVSAVYADAKSGSNATVFQNAQGATYLAVAGTNPATGADLWADVQLAVGVPANTYARNWA